MKSLFTTCLLFVAIVAQAQFTANNLAVLKITAGGAAITDDGGATATNAVLRPATIMQFATTGENQTGAAVVTLNSTGTDPKLTIDQRRIAHEGHLNLSGDRNYLTLVGYNTEAGLLAASGTPNGRTSEKRVARIPASGIADITTSIPTTAAYSNNSVRAVVSIDGSTFTIAGSGGTATTGIQTVNYGANTASPFLAKDCRGLGLYNSIVYGYASAGTIEGGGQTISALGTELTQFVFFDRDAAVDWAGTGFDLLYIADRNSGIRKFAYDGSAWVAKGVGAFVAAGTAPAGGVQTLTGRIEDGKPTLYCTKAIVASSVYTGSHLLRVVDNAARDAFWDVTGGFPTSTALASTGNTERLVGVAFTPGSDLVSIPVELMSFKGSLINDKANLQWATATEINAKEFIVEKSTNAKEFAPIGAVAAKGGNVKTTYDFDDSKLNEDVNYYRLKMMDNDGSFKYSNIVAIKLGGKGAKGLSVFPNPVANTLTIEHTAAADGALIRIFSLAGSNIIQYNVAKDATQTSVDASQLPAGQYFINYISRDMTVTTSFVK